MISPFSTFEEFSEAEGPIYTFANSPAIIGLLLVLCVAIALYFLYVSFGMTQEKLKHPVALSLLLLAGAVSLLTLPFQPTQSEASRRTSQPERSMTWQPLALLGLIGGGRSFDQSAKRQSRRRRLRH